MKRITTLFFLRQDTSYLVRARKTEIISKLEFKADFSKIPEQIYDLSDGDFHVCRSSMSLGSSTINYLRSPYS